MAMEKLARAVERLTPSIRWGTLDALERVFSDRAVVAETLDVEQTPGEADLPQRREVMQPSADGEVVSSLTSKPSAHIEVIATTCGLWAARPVTSFGSSPTCWANGFSTSTGSRTRWREN
jgi:hypothetical protein